jgi:hypothetical protein
MGHSGDYRKVDHFSFIGTLDGRPYFRLDDPSAVYYAMHAFLTSGKAGLMWLILGCLGVFRLSGP